MTTQTKAPSQGLLFSEPSYSETAVWCELTEGIDPAEWAKTCRYLGRLTPIQFEITRKRLFQPKKSPGSPFNIYNFLIQRSPDSLISRFKRLFSFKQEEFEHLPLICMEPEGITEA